MSAVVCGTTYRMTGQSATCTSCTQCWSTLAAHMGATTSPSSALMATHGKSRCHQMAAAIYWQLMFAALLCFDDGEDLATIPCLCLLSSPVPVLKLMCCSCRHWVGANISAVLPCWSEPAG
jgi:hypothetical protein